MSSARIVRIFGWQWILNVRIRRYMGSDRPEARDRSFELHAQGLAQDRWRAEDFPIECCKRSYIRQKLQL